MLAQPLEKLMYINSLFDLFLLAFLETSFCPFMNKSRKQNFLCTLAVSGLFIGVFTVMIHVLGYPFPGYILYYIAIGTVFLVFAGNRLTAFVMVLFVTIGNAYFRYCIDALIQILIPSVDALTLSYNIRADFIILSVSLVYTIILKRFCTHPSFFISQWQQIICAGLLILLYAFLFLPSRLLNSLNMLFLYMLLFLTITIMLYFILQAVSRYQETMFNYRLVQRENSMNADRLQDIQEVYENIRTLRHEQKNSLFYIQSLIKLKDYDKLREYAEKLTHTEKSYLSNVETGNILVNIILQPYLARAEDQRVTFTVNAILPEQLSIDDESLISLLANLLDNAWENADPSHPEIHVDMKILKDYLLITVENSVPGNVLNQNPLLRSSKKDTALHGIGTRVIKKITEEHGGSIQYSCTDQMFTADVMLPIETAEML